MELVRVSLTQGSKHFRPHGEQPEWQLFHSQTIRIKVSARSRAAQTARAVPPLLASRPHPADPLSARARVAAKEGFAGLSGSVNRLRAYVCRRALALGPC